MKEVIQRCLPFSLPAHPLKMGSVLAQSLYDLKYSFCTYNHTVILNSTTHFDHPLRGGRRHHFRIITRINLLCVASHLLLVDWFSESVHIGIDRHPIKESEFFRVVGSMGCRTLWCLLQCTWYMLGTSFRALNGLAQAFTLPFFLWHGNGGGNCSVQSQNDSHGCKKFIGGNSNVIYGQILVISADE